MEIDATRTNRFHATSCSPPMFANARAAGRMRCESPIMPRWQIGEAMRIVLDSRNIRRRIGGLRDVGRLDPVCHAMPKEGTGALDGEVCDARFMFELTRKEPRS